jgi:hypothetical protein
MATHQLAQGLASLGRHGDSMLMHVSPSEVAGLKAVGAMTGHKLHTNPHTGMPEAFDFGDFFASLLPTAAGFLVGGPAGAAMGLKGTAATLAPIAAGMATGAAVAGAKGDDLLTGTLMGGLGGFGGGNLGSSLGKMGAQGGYQAGQEVAKGTAQTTAAGLDALDTAANPFFGSANTMPTALTNAGSTAASGAAAPMTYSQGLGQMGRGASELLSPGGYDKFTSPAIGGSGMQLATSIGLPAYSAMQPKPVDTTEEEAKRKAEANKYVDKITGRLNPYQSSPDFGTMLMATGGTVNTNSSSIASGGIQDLYGTNDQTTGTQNLSKEGYGIGRLNSLAAEGSRAKAADTFYAAGGPIAFAEGGSSNIYIPGYNSPSFSQGSLGGNPLLTLLAQMFAKQGLLNPQANASTASTSSTPSTPTTIDPLNAPGMYPQAADDYMATKATDKGTFALEAAKGGYLDGAGDGMSDSIPGTIEGKQPARLADGEFVIPADVVSHLGNGSSKAGSKQLYTMLDRIRKARTGHTKQGKEIKPQKYMPA